MATSSKLKAHPPAEVSFDWVGRNNATTFAGLCARHDNDIFREIDDHIPDHCNPEHLFLLAYRSVLRELHAVIQNAIRIQLTYQKRVEIGVSPGDAPCQAGLLATAYVINAYESYEYKRQFDQVYLSQGWNELHHEVIRLADQRPTVAVSAMFSLDEVEAPETPRATLNIYPAGQDVIAVVSSTAADRPYVAPLVSRIVTAEGHYQKYLLSRLVLQRTSNFVLAPSHFDTLTATQKQAMCQYFVDTFIDDYDDRDDHNLYLF